MKTDKLFLTYSVIQITIIFLVAIIVYSLDVSQVLQSTVKLICLYNLIVLAFRFHFVNKDLEDFENQSEEEYYTSFKEAIEFQKKYSMLIIFK